MKKNLFFIIVAFVSFALIVGLPFAFTEWNDLLVHNQTILVMYIISKCLFGLYFLAASIWSCVDQRARSMVFIIMGSAAISQACPVLIRTGLYLPNNWQIIYPILVLFVFVVVMVVMIGLVFHSNKKQVVSDSKYQGNEIDIKEER